MKKGSSALFYQSEVNIDLDLTEASLKRRFYGLLCHSIDLALNFFF